MAKIDLANRKVLGYLSLGKGRMPQHIRVSPDGKVFFVAGMKSASVHLIDGAPFTKIGLIETGVGAHGLYPNRDGRRLYVASHGSDKLWGTPRGKGSVSVIDFAARKAEATWPIPGGISFDMRKVSADGKTLCLSGRFDDLICVIDTSTGATTTIT